MTRPIPASHWIWDGHAGHLIVAFDCRFHLTTRVGNYRISTVGDWQERKGDEPKEIGAGRTHETYVFRTDDDGNVDVYTEIDSDVYGPGVNACAQANAGHMAMCRKYARIAGAER